MKRFQAFVFCLMLAFSATFTLANEQVSTLNVDTSLTSDIHPDVAFISFKVVNQGLNIQELKDKNDKIANKAINDIKAKLGNDETIKTTAYRINNIYTNKDKVSIFQKYEVVNSFEVKLKDFSKISQIIQLATDAGAKKVDYVRFAIDNTQNVCNELLAKTTKNAKDRAKIIADSLEAQILKVKSVNPYCSLDSGYSQIIHRNFKAMNASDTNTESKPVIESIEPGTVNVKTSVNLIYYLK